jgi:L-ascorbate metabolism protein UlaG (beta-lactamase superfamily)
MNRRVLLGAGTLGVAGLATAAYRAAPTFWRQYRRELGREVLPAPAVPHVREWPGRGLHAAWLGHTTVLLQIDGFTILTDPVLHERVGIGIGPFTLGLKRLVAPALPIPNLPHIDLILLSHAHMDHFDVRTLRDLENRKTAVVTAHNTSDLLRPERYREVRELRWNERTRVGPVNLSAFRVNHWGARMRSDTYRGYNGYVIESGKHRVLFAGDTAQTGLFRELKSSRPFDLGIFPIGAYNPWIHYHCTPEEAWRMGNQAGAERFLPVHHQTFQLSREPFHEPIERFEEAAGNSQDRIAVRRIGQEFRA